jgi:hypothetical protein
VFAHHAADIAKILGLDKRNKLTMQHVKLLCERAVEFDRNWRTTRGRYLVGLRPAIETAEAHAAELRRINDENIASPLLRDAVASAQSEIARLLQVVEPLKGRPRGAADRSDAVFYIASLYRDYTGEPVTKYRDSGFAELLDRVLGIKDPIPTIRAFLTAYPGFGVRKSGQ